MYTAQPEARQGFVNAARSSCGGEHSRRLNTCSGLSQHIQRIDGEIVCQSGYLLPPHRRGEEEAVYQYHGHTMVWSVLIHPSGAVSIWHIVYDVRPGTQCAQLIVDSQIVLPRQRTREPIGVRAEQGTPPVHALLSRLRCREQICALGHLDQVSAVENTDSCRSVLVIGSTVIGLRSSLFNQSVMVRRREVQTSLRGKVVVITGAGRGIGASLARQLHARHARLVLIDTDESGLAMLVDKLGRTDIESIHCDVNDLEAMKRGIDAAAIRFGAIDIVVANAGTEHWAPVQSVDPAAFRRVLETNVIGVFNTVRSALPRVIDRRGYILVVASVSSYTAVPGMASYGASKAGVEQFANVLRIELAHRGVAVGSAHMSLVDTPMLCETRASSPEFTALISALPTVMRRPMTADACAARLVDGIERRKRHIDVPRWVTAARWFKPLLATSMAALPMTRQFRRVEVTDRRP